MREIRLSGSEGGGVVLPLSLPLSWRFARWAAEEPALPDFDVTLPQRRVARVAGQARGRPPKFSRRGDALLGHRSSDGFWNLFRPKAV
jgi:hypothetical protein